MSKVLDKGRDSMDRLIDKRLNEVLRANAPGKKNGNGQKSKKRR